MTEEHAETTEPPVSLEIVREILRRGETADDRVPVNLNELRGRIAARQAEQR